MENLNEEIHNAEIIKEAELSFILQTPFKVGCDAINPEAVAKIYKLKQRAET
jgi:L-threonylcarbamoyladenylate synthase